MENATKTQIRPGQKWALKTNKKHQITIWFAGEVRVAATRVDTKRYKNVETNPEELVRNYVLVDN